MTESTRDEPTEYTTLGPDADGHERYATVDLGDEVLRYDREVEDA